MRRAAGGARWPRRFFWKLYGTYVGVVVLSAAAVAALVFEFFADSAQASMREQMSQLAALLASLEAANPRELWTPIAQNRVEELARSSGAQIDIVLADGSVAATSRERFADASGALALPEFLQARESGGGEAIRVEDGRETLHIVQAMAIRHEKIGYVRVSRPMDHLGAEFRRLASGIAAGAAVAAALSLVGGIWFGRTVTRPLQRIEQGCLRIAAGERGERIGLRRADEFGVVARTVDDMAESLTRQMRQVEQQKNRSELLLRLLHDAVIAIDGEGRVAFMNAAAEAYCRCGDVASCLGKPFREALAVAPLLRMVEERAPGAGDEERAFQWQDRSGQRRYASARVSPLRESEHDLAGLLVVARDTTESRLFENLRRDFASNVSHELKTPVTAIATLIEALVDGAARNPELRASFLDRIRLQNQRMKRLVDELLAISRLESGKGMLELRRCDAREAIRSAGETFPPMAAYRGVAFSVESPDAPIFVNGDLRALEVMVNSLVDNALKFTPQGGRIGLTLSSARGVAEVQVRDTGCGIPAAHRERVFERFYRIDASRARDRGGSGLGLAIVKHMAIAHGGDVRLESREGEGSCFTVTLPLA